MNTFLIIILIFVLILILVNLWFYVKSKKSVGKKILFDRIKSDLKNKIQNNKGILYFYSENCSNCKVQLNILKNMDLKGTQLIEINVHEENDTARTFNVMGTPSMVFFSNNKIVGYFVGVKNDKFISNNIENLL